MTSTRLAVTGLLLILLGLPILLRGLRTGRLLQRGPHHRIDRHRQPVRFWSTIALCGAASLFGFVMLAAGLMRALT